MTSWRCSPTSPPSITGAERTITAKILLLPDNDQAEAFRFFYGAERFMWNSCKAVADKSTQEAMEARISELVREHDDGTCHHGGCGEEVVEPDGEYDSKKRWYCGDHVDAARFGASPKITGRCRPYEAAKEDAFGACISVGCDEPLMGDTLRCKDHQDDTTDDPQMPTPSSPYHFEAIKTIVCPPSSELLANRKWLDGVPCNTKTGAISKFTSAASSTFTKWRKGDKKARLPGFKSRKDRHQEFSVRSTAIQFKKGKAGCSPKARKRSKNDVKGSRKQALGPGRRKKSSDRTARPRGRRSRPWSLRVFPNLPGSDKMDLVSEEEKARADRAKAGMRRPIRTLRKDMVRLKRFNQKGRWCDSKIMRNECGRHYLVLVMKVPARESSPIWESQAYTDAFLDPGGRTFQTVYSPDGVAAKIGDEFYVLMLGKLRRADRIMGAAARRKANDGPMRGYRRMLARAQALRTKVRNCVRDLHRKAAKFLCANFKAIYIPRFESGRIARSTELSRRIGNGAVRSLMTFSHAQFFNMLKQYALARGVHVIEVGESYTTKTCTFCGFQNNVGSKKSIKCASCGKRADRDYAAGRNIGIRTAMSTS
jgi:putative transposase